MQSHRHESGVFVLRPGGPRLDADNAHELKSVLTEHIASGDRELCVVLDEVEAMDSTGLGVLTGAVRQLGERGQIRLCEVRPPVRTLLEMTQMNRLFRIYDSMDQALADPVDPAE
jgi:anti-sigma B factor antagonist